MNGLNLTGISRFPVEEEMTESAGGGSVTSGDNGETNTQPNLNPFGKPSNLSGESGRDGNNGGSANGNNANANANANANVNPNANNAGGASNPGNLDSFVSTLPLMDGVDLSSLDDDQRTAVSAAMQKMGENSIKQSLLLTNRLMRQQIEAATKEAVSQSTGQMDSRLAVRRMQQELSYTKAAENEHIAKATLAGFMSQGQDIDTAIDNVDKYFRQFAKSMGAEFANPPPGRAGTETPPGSRVAGNKNSQRAGANASAFGNDDIDFLQLLGGSD